MTWHPRCQHCQSANTRAHCADHRPSCPWHKCEDCGWLSDNSKRSMPDERDPKSYEDLP